MKFMKQAVVLFHNFKANDHDLRFYLAKDLVW